jgi:hypothetical protein
VRRHVEQGDRIMMRRLDDYRPEILRGEAFPEHSVAKAVVMRVWCQVKTRTPEKDQNG